MKIKPIHFIICITVIPLLDTGFSLKAQETNYFKEHELARDSLLSLARTIINSAECRTFVTVDEDNKPQARAMSPFPPEEDFTIFLGTNPASRKVKQLKKNPNVMVYYYDSDGRSYVSVAGKAELIDEPRIKKKYWRDGWIGFYPDFEKNYVLIKVSPKHMEICSFEHELFWGPEGMPAAVDF